MNNSGLVKNNQQSYYHLDFYERSPFPFSSHNEYELPVDITVVVSSALLAVGWRCRSGNHCKHKRRQTTAADDEPVEQQQVDKDSVAVVVGDGKYVQR